MFSAFTRRRFVTTAAQGGLFAGLGGFAFLDQLPAAEVAKAALPKTVEVASDIEPLVLLIEETPRDKLTAQVIDRIRQGTSYQELLSAVFLAGVRGIQPRPVGFKFHAVLVINSAHLASLASTDKDRWLPLLWAIDYFKGAQKANRDQGDWRMAPVDESKLPGENVAKQRFLDAMETWNTEEADRAIAAWGRVGSASEVWEPFWQLGARDFRDIGHKAIFVANAWRTMQTIGWRHREPVLRSLAYALLEHEGTNPAKRDDHRDRPGRDNLERARKFKNFRDAGKRDEKVATELLTAMRKASAEDASKQVAELIEKGIHPATIWDGLFLTAGELLMRQPGIVGLHCLTTTNALHYASQTAATPATRAYVLLQAAAFLPMFRQAMTGRGKVSDARLDALEPADSKEPVSEILADISTDRTLAARKTLSLLKSSPQQIVPLMREARRLIFAKGTDSHDYKFSSAVLEDAFSVTPALRPMYMATSVFNLKGSGARDNALIEQARAALAKS